MRRYLILCINVVKGETRVTITILHSPDAAVVVPNWVWTDYVTDQVQHNTQRTFIHVRASKALTCISAYI